MLTRFKSNIHKKKQKNVLIKKEIDHFIDHFILSIPTYDTILCHCFVVFELLKCRNVYFTEFHWPDQHKTVKNQILLKKKDIFIKFKAIWSFDLVWNLINVEYQPEGQKTFIGKNLFEKYEQNRLIFFGQASSNLKKAIITIITLVNFQIMLRLQIFEIKDLEFKNKP